MAGKTVLTACICGGLVEATVLVAAASGASWVGTVIYNRRRFRMRPDDRDRSATEQAGVFPDEYGSQPALETDSDSPKPAPR